MVEILSAHGSKNDIFVAAMRPRDFVSESDLHAFVRRMCDRNGPLGGDGIYFYDAGPRVPQAWFFNPDGSAAEFCGNGMRCLGRVLLDLRGTDVATVRSGQREYTVRRGQTTAEGVHQVSLEHPAVDFSPQVPVVAGRSPLIQARLPELDPALRFTAVTIPNPHLVALIDSYAESELIAMGERIAARRDVFPVGANLSVLLPLGPTEVFVRTFERGAGLTASCGSGMAASRAVYSLPGLVDPERRVVIRNAGGTATVSLRVQQGQWCPVLEGNATFVYRVPVDPAALARGHRAVDGKRELCRDEIRAYAALDVQNVARLRAVGIESAAFATPAAEAPAAEALDVLRLCREAGDLAKNKLKPKLKLEIVKSPDDLPPRAGSRRRRHSVPPGRGRPPRSPHRGRRPPG
jgi:diaminopimelate epimerase